MTAPVDTSLVEGAPAAFSVTTTGDATDVTWETSSDGVTWTEVPGVSGPTLTLHPVLADSGLQVRAIVQSVVFAWLTSAFATLTVTPAPTPRPTPTPAPTPSQTSTLLPTDDDVLPDTGGSDGSLAALAAGLVVLGATGVALARRRRA